MPNYLTILAVRPSLDELPLELRESTALSYPEPGDDLETWTTLSERLQALGEMSRDLGVDVLFRGGSDWIGLGCLSLLEGRVVARDLMLSSHADRFVDPGAKPAPEVSLQLGVPADGVVDVVAEAADEDTDIEWEDNELRLPFSYRSSSSLLAAAATVAGARPHSDPIGVVVEVEGTFRALRLSANGVSLELLHVWTGDHSLREWISARVPPASKTLTAEIKPVPKTIPRDPRRPLTTGSLRSRLDAVYEMTHPTETLEESGFILRRRKEPGRDVYDRLLAALESPANETEQFAALRQQLFRSLVELSPWRAARPLVSRLRIEAGKTRETLYDAISHCKDRVAYAAMAKGLSEEDPGLRCFLWQVIARQPEAVELFVKETLIPTFSRDPNAAAAALARMDHECIRVPRVLLAGAPPELVVALGWLVT